MLTSLSSFLRRSAALRILGCGAALCLAACGDDDDTGEESVGPTGVVELDITGFTNDRGDEFERNASEITLSCDGTITVEFGPRTSDGLKNWLLRPPGTCGSFEQCGYLVLTLASAGAPPTERAAASTTLTIAAEPGAATLTAQLFTGEGEPFEQDDETVKDELDTHFVVSNDCEASFSTSTATTGVGGTGSEGTTGAGGAPMGGAGGEGGEGGAAGMNGGEAGAPQG